MAKVNKTLPVATAVFPKLNKVDVYQPKNAKGQPSGPEKRTWNTRLKFNDEDHREVDAWLKKLAKETGKRIVILHCHPLVTSARKMKLYTAREHLRFLFRVIFSQGRQLRNRDAAHLWYDGRR